MSEPEFVEGADKLIRVFGYWPSFHDAEVVSMTFDRCNWQDGLHPTLDAVIHAFEVTTEIDAEGAYVCRHHVRIQLRFRQIEGLSLQGFNHQNVLSSLEFVDLRKQGLASAQFEIQFNDSFGVGAVFRCRSIELVDVTPWGRDGVAAA